MATMLGGFFLELFCWKLLLWKESLLETVSSGSSVKGCLDELCQVSLKLLFTFHPTYTSASFPTSYFSLMKLLLLMLAQKLEEIKFNFFSHPCPESSPFIAASCFLCLVWVEATIFARVKFSARYRPMAVMMTVLSGFSVTPTQFSLKLATFKLTEAMAIKKISHPEKGKQLNSLSLCVSQRSISYHVL